MNIEASERIATLDILRGVAVMGILAMNIVSFADVPAAYLNPLAQTVAVRTGDLLVYAGNFLLVDGKMRGLFSFLFGASVLLIAERSQAGLVVRRLFWLLIFGALHFYLLWWGDILIGYALLGFLALAFRNASPRALVLTAVILIAAQFAIFAGMTAWSLSLQEAMANSPDARTVEAWTQMTRDMAVPTDAHRASVLALYLGSWSGIVEHQLTDKTFFPLVGVFVFGWETLGYMLLGMAALKTGLLSGAWEDRRYLKWALVCLAIALPVYVVALRFLFGRSGRYRPSSCRASQHRAGQALDGRRIRLPDHPGDAARRRAGGADCSHRAWGVQQLPRHEHRHGIAVLRLWPGCVRQAWAG
jgi:uncharacterized protein